MESFNLLVLGFQSLVLLVLGVACFWFFIDRKNKKSLALVFVYTFLFKICISIILLRYIDVVHGDMLLSKDTEKIASFAYKIIRSGFVNFDGYMPAGIEKLPYYYALVYKFIGTSTVYVSTIWIFISSLVAVPIHSIARRIYSYRVAYLSAVLVLIYPSFLVMSVVPHKSVLSAFFLSLSVLSILLTDSWIKKYFLFMVGAVGLLTVRPEMMLVLLISYIIWHSVFTSSSRQRVTSLENLSYTILVSIAFYMVVDFEYLSQLATLENVFGRINIIQERTTASGGVHDFIINQNIFVRSFIGSILLLIKPFPPTSTLQSLDISALMTPSAILLLSIMPYTLVGGWKAVTNRETSTLLVVLFLATIFVSAAAVGSTTERYRVQIMPFALVLFSSGFYSDTNKTSFIISYYVLVILGILLYVSLKISM